MYHPGANSRRVPLTEPFVVVDIETSGLDPRKGAELLCVAWSTETQPTQVSTTIPDELAKRLYDPLCPIVSQSKFDPVWFRKDGMWVTAPFFDTMVMAHLLNENTKLDLETLSEVYLGQTMDKRLVREDNQVWFVMDSGEKKVLAEAFKVVPEQIMEYCKRDVETTTALYLSLRGAMEKVGWWSEFVTEHAPFTEVLVDMECEGIPINLESAATLQAKLEVVAEEQKQQLIKDLGYELNFGSPKQLRTVLFSEVWEQELKVTITKEQRDLLKAGLNNEPVTGEALDDSTNDIPKDKIHFLPPNFEVTKVGRLYAYGTVMQRGLGITPKVKTDTGLWSTSTPVLTTYHGGNEIVSDLVDYRKTKKVIGTYLATYPDYSYEGNLYGRFNQTGTATGRLSHSNPNLGNQPTRGELGTLVRGLFQGRFIIGDHGQLENRLMAHFSGDPVLMEVYREGKDIHLVTAEFVFGKTGLTKDSVERDIAKTFGYAMGYGAAANKLAEIMALNGFWTPLDRVKEYLAELEKLYKVFFSWKRNVMYQAKANGYVKTIGGRYRRLRHAYDDKHFRVRNKADRQAVNSIIQGSAADILRRNMLHVRAAYPWLPLLNQVHDELMWNYKGVEDRLTENTLNELQYICEHPGYDIKVPLKFEPSYCDTWADKGAGSIELPDTDMEEDEAA